MVRDMTRGTARARDATTRTFWSREKLFSRGAAVSSHKSADANLTVARPLLDPGAARNCRRPRRQVPWRRESRGMRGVDE
jgi:hypothetical protein